MTHLAAGEDAQTDGALVVEETPDKILVMRLLHGLHHILQGVADTRLLEQRQDELAAPPAGQVIQCQQPPARPLKEASQVSTEVYVKMKKIHVKTKISF